MGYGHTFGGISNKVSCYQRIFHANVAHCDTVTYGNCGEHNGCTACHGYAEFNGFHDFIKIHVSGYYFVVRRNNTDHGTLSFFFSKSESIE